CNADFLHGNRTAMSKLSAFFGGVDLVLLNPPFSQRGTKPLRLRIHGEDTRCGTATAFVCKSVEFLASGGHLIGVLPGGSLCSQRDKHAWDILRAHWLVEEVADLGTFAFRGVTAGARILRISHSSTLPKIGRS